MKDTSLEKKTENTQELEQKKLLEDLTVLVLEHQVFGAKELANKLKLSVSEVAKLISSPGFVKTIENYQKNLASIEYDATAYRKALDLIQTGSEKAATANIKNLGDILGKTTSKEKTKGFQQQININLTREEEKELKTLEKIEVLYPGFDNE